MRRAVAAVFLSVLLLFVGVDSSAIGEPSEAVPAAVESAQRVGAGSTVGVRAYAAIAVRAVRVWLLGLVALALSCVETDRDDRRSLLRWVAPVRRGPPALAR